LGFGCKYCTGKEIHPEDAEASMIKRGYKPLSKYPGASKPWLVRCVTCNREQKVKMHSVTSIKRCVYCARRKLDLNEVAKRLEFLEFKPLEKFKNARAPWKIKCLRCSHTIYPSWAAMNKKDRNRGCGYCVRVKVDIKVANRLLKKLRLKPLVKYPGGKNPWKCKCLKCGSIVYPHYGDLNQGQGGCSNCADYGLNYTDKGYLYLITHPLLGAHKIGIANSYKSRELDDRMYKHKKHGWKLYKTKNFTKLRKAYQVEQDIIKWFRVEIGLPMYLSDNQMPQGGWTETVDASEIDLPTIWAKVEELSRVKK
jgi:ribosomal protein S27E